MRGRMRARGTLSPLMSSGSSTLVTPAVLQTAICPILAAVAATTTCHRQTPGNCAISSFACVSLSTCKFLQ